MRSGNMRDAKIGGVYEDSPTHQYEDLCGQTRQKHLQRRNSRHIFEESTSMGQ